MLETYLFTTMNRLVSALIILFICKDSFTQNKTYVEAEVVYNDTLETNSSTTQEIIDQSEKVFENYYKNKQSVKEDKKLIIKDEKLIEKININFPYMNQKYLK